MECVLTIHNFDLSLKLKQRKQKIDTKSNQIS